MTDHSPTHTSGSQQISSRHGHSQHQHSHSAPHEPQRHSHERQASDELRRYYQHSASQQPLRGHSHHTSPKRAYLQPSGHSDTRLHPDHHYPGMVVMGHREDHEGSRYIDQRRRSADPSMIVNYDHQAPYHCSNTQPSPYITPGTKDKRVSRPQFEDTGPGSDEVSSQSCDILTPAAITFSIEETVDDTKSNSSTSTLVENGSNGSQPRQVPEASTPKPLSQEIFGEDDHHETGMMLSTVCEGVPLSSQPHYFEPAFSQAPYHHGLSQPSLPKTRHGKSLTDINSAASPVTMNAGGNSNLLALRQFLSQSVDLPHYSHPGQQRYTTDSLPRHARLLAPPGVVKHSQSVSHNHIHRMASDSHLNYEGPPGQQRSMLNALNRTRGEIEQKKQQLPRQRNGHNHTRKQFKSHYLQKKHVQATVVSQTARPTNKIDSQDKRYPTDSCSSVVCHYHFIFFSPKHKLDRSSSAIRTQKPSKTSSSTGNSPSSPSKMAAKSSALPSTSTNLAFQGKSKSTSCLNLQQLL